MNKAGELKKMEEERRGVRVGKGRVVEGIGEGRFKEKRRRVGVGKGRVVEGIGEERFKEERI